MYDGCSEETPMVHVEWKNDGMMGWRFLRFGIGNIWKTLLGMLLGHYSYGMLWPFISYDWL